MTELEIVVHHNGDNWIYNNNININVYFRHKVHMLHIENLYIQCYNK